MEYNELVKASDALLFSAEFKEIEAQVKESIPNIWEILNISRKEILVSQFLGWLLDPKTNHSMSDTYLKGFIMAALRTGTGKVPLELSPVEISVMNLIDAHVGTERWLDKRRCDIIIECEKCGLLCIIENKVGSDEGVEQTQYYYEHSFTKYPKETYPKRIYLYLTPHADPPHCEHFMAISYQAILDSIVDVQARHISETERFLLRQFQENLKRRIVVDKKTLDLVQSIYDAHRTTIEFIISNADRLEPEDIDAVWDGKSWFFNIGETGPDSYSWDDCRTYSFLCAGGGRRYRQIMEGFKVGDIIYAYASGWGYVGVGTVTKAAVPFRKATLKDGKTTLIDLSRKRKLKGTYDWELNYDECDWIALVTWQKALVKEKAVRELPVVPSTSSRIYNHRKGLVQKVRKGLGIQGTDR